MTELRLLPAAAVVWIAVAVVLVSRSWSTGIAVVVVAGLIAVGFRAPGQCLLILGAGGAAVVTSRCRLAAADRHHLNSLEHVTVEGRTVTGPVRVGDDGWLLRLHVPGHPAEIPVFIRGGEEIPKSAGTLIRVTADTGAADRPGIGTLLLNAHSVTVLHGPSGPARAAAHVRDSFADTAARYLDPESAGLVRGMVLGDITGQGDSQRQMFLDTGLSHLSAVSGSNVAIVTTTVVILTRLLGVGPRVQVAGAGCVLAAFVGLVGTEPSVLRAAATGIVGLVAVLAATRAEPAHALCLSTIVLLLWRSDLAVSYGFALSVAATAGIIALHPLLHRPLAATGWPAIIVRALSVAIAADIVTMPIIAIMAGRVSLVSVAANVFAAVAVPPITVLGLVAALLAAFPGPGPQLAGACLWMLTPLLRWINGVAGVFAGLPHATVPVAAGWLGVAWVILGCCWTVWAIYAGQVRVLVLGAVLLTLISVVFTPHRSEHPVVTSGPSVGMWHDGARETVTPRPRAPDPR
ncbi:ComEC/Rec2 family competence protein [Corynebacterium sp. CCM 9204]|uniref:ComEC/Rec2 family competence protein n=1 Tax=Corynebacterium sp. CCM 9204 TaxID=3057616 RepID=UPI003524C31C